MLTTEHTETYGWVAAIRGMRNPMNSWEKSNSQWKLFPKDGDMVVGWEGGYGLCLGKNDRVLMMQLRNAGSDHRKFMRQIMVSVDITAPLYWWKEFDTYKVGTTANSCSTMHKITEKEFTLDDFSHEHLFESAWYNEQYIPFTETLDHIIVTLNYFRTLYRENHDEKYWYQIIQLLPSSYNQRRTVTLNYEVLTNIYHARRNHKLTEWHTLCDWIKTLPYSELITGEESTT